MAILFSVKKTVLSFNENKPQVYKITAVPSQLYSFDKLLSEVASSCSLNRSQTKAVIEALIDRLIMLMDLGVTVRLGEFGSFKPSFTAKSQKTLDTVGVDNVIRKKILFYPGKRFKDMLNSMEVVSKYSLDDAEVKEEKSNASASSSDNTGGKTGGQTSGGSTTGGDMPL